MNIIQETLHTILLDYKPGISNIETFLENHLADMFDHGYHSGYKEGLQDGENSGYKEGYNIGYKEGNSDGIDEGYKAGLVDANHNHNT